MWALSTFQWSHMTVYDLLLFRWSPKQACKISVHASLLFKTIPWLPQPSGPRPTLLKLPSTIKSLHSQCFFLLQAFAQLLSDLGTFFPVLQWLIHFSRTHPYILTVCSPVFSHDCNLPIRVETILVQANSLVLGANSDS